MKLTVIRPPACGERYTRSPLLIDGKYECEVLEDQDRLLEAHPENKVQNQTCIPRGTYNVTITMSNRFKRRMPLIENVPGFQGVRIHSGNTVEDTEGCLLVGLKDDLRPDVVLMSRVTFGGVFSRIDAALERGEKVELEIR